MASHNWPAWKKVFAYAILAALAGVSIWYVDRRAAAPVREQEQTAAEQRVQQ